MQTTNHLLVPSYPFFLQYPSGCDGSISDFIGDEKGAHQDALEAQKLGHPPSDLIELTSKYIKE